jgi:hypothetical protein
VRFTVEYRGQQVEVVSAEAFDFVVDKYTRLMDLFEATVDLAALALSPEPVASDQKESS